MLTAQKPRTDVEPAVPLVIDLDGTLIRSDLLVETLAGSLAGNPLKLLDLFQAWRQGRAQLKDVAAQSSHIDVAALPYDPEIVQLVKDAKAEGRKVYLASASNERLVERVADHLGLFDGWYASSPAANLKAEAKAARLIAEFGEKGFDYIGNDDADLPVWANARKAFAVRASAATAGRLRALKPDAEVLSTQASSVGAWLKLMRVHQYAKNLLVFVPLVAAHAFSSGSITRALVAFVAFSLCASGVYILNDLVDLAADRAHPTKRNRPLAAGTVPIHHALFAAPALLVAAFLLAAMTNAMFVGMLAIYFVLTSAYSLWLKRKMLVDAVALAGLYTLRVIGGATAIAVPVSKWLLAFSLFIFMSLALVKRYVELVKLLDNNLPNPTNRGYQKGDLPIIASLAAAAGYNAVIVLALYMSSDAVAGLYRNPELLWLVCPIVMYWISRLLLKAHRRQIDDDPVVFALQDRVSLAVAGAIAIVGALAL
jgi:4-hydroxybenzoate polyprenyltransferase